MYKNKYKKYKLKYLNLKNGGSSSSFNNEVEDDNKSKILF